MMKFIKGIKKFISWLFEDPYVSAEKRLNDLRSAEWAMYDMSNLTIRGRPYSQVYCREYWHQDGSYVWEMKILDSVMTIPVWRPIYNPPLPLISDMELND